MGLIILIIIMILICIKDYQSYIIPDELIIIGIINGIVFYSYKNIISSLIVFFLVYTIVYIVSKINDKDVMGGGDLKLIFMLGLYLNLKANLKALILSCIIGIIYASLVRNKKIIAFGPCLCIGYLAGIIYFTNIMI